MVATSNSQPSPLPNRRKFLTQLLIDVVCFFATVVVGIGVAVVTVRAADWMFFENLHIGPMPSNRLQNHLRDIGRLFIAGLVFIAVIYVYAVMSIGVRVAARLRSYFGVACFWDDVEDGERNT